MNESSVPTAPQLHYGQTMLQERRLFEAPLWDPPCCIWGSASRDATTSGSGDSGPLPSHTQTLSSESESTVHLPDDDTPTCQVEEGRSCGEAQREGQGVRVSIRVLSGVSWLHPMAL